MGQGRQSRCAQAPCLLLCGCLEGTTITAEAATQTQTGLFAFLCVPQGCAGQLEVISTRDIVRALTVRIVPGGDAHQLRRLRHAAVDGWHLQRLLGLLLLPLQVLLAVLLCKNTAAAAREAPVPGRHFHAAGARQNRTQNLFNGLRISESKTLPGFWCLFAEVLAWSLSNPSSSLSLLPPASPPAFSSSSLLLCKELSSNCFKLQLWYIPVHFKHHLTYCRLPLL